MRKSYRLKHIPTGLYWKRKSYGSLSETGTVYSSGNHAFSGWGQDESIQVCIDDDKMIHRHLDVLSTVGTIQTYPVEKWDSDKREFVPTGKTRLRWYMKSKVSDFEKEFVTLEPEAPEPSVIRDNEEIVERVTRACWDQMFSISKELMPYEDLLSRVKNQLNIK